MSAFESLTRDQLVRRLNAAQKTIEALREWNLNAPRWVFSGDGYWIRLDRYQLSNLKSLIDAIRFHRGSDPLGFLDTGDWCGEIEGILATIPGLERPNSTPEELRERAEREKPND